MPQKNSIQFRSSLPPFRVWMAKGLQQIPLGLYMGSTNLKVRLRQAKSGYILYLVKALIPTTFYFLFFHYVFSLDTGETPYLLFVLTGILFWFLFIEVFNQVLSVFETPPATLKNSPLHLLVYPISAMVQVMLEFIPYLLFFIAGLWYFEVALSFLMIPAFTLLPGVAVFATTTAICCGFLGIQKPYLFQLFRQVVGFFIWVAPVFYPISILPEWAQNILYLNPLTGFLETFRWMVFSAGNTALNMPSIIVFMLTFSLALALLYASGKKLNELS